MKDVFKRICLAQIASDGGKNISFLRSYNPKIWEAGYPAKDREILRAINLIKSGKGYGVSFYVTAGDKSVHDCPSIVYFNYKLNGARKQISFHTYSAEIGALHSTAPVHITRWDRKSSRDNVLELLKGGI